MMRGMMQGDQYRLPIYLKHADGEPVTPEDVKEIEVTVGCIRRILTDGGVEYSEDENVFYVYIRQEDSFLLRNAAKVQCRVRLRSDDVVGIDLGTIQIAESSSKVKI